MLDNKKILITGNTGFKGAWLTLYLKKTCTSDLYGFSDNIPWVNGIFSKKNIKNYTKQYWGNICKFDAIHNCLKEIKPDIIFHLAAQPIVSIGYMKPRETFETNINGTLNLLEAAKNIDKEVKIILITSDKVYKSKNDLKVHDEISEIGGSCPYSSSKACCEIIAETYAKILKNASICTVRAGNVIGGGDWSKDRIVPDLFKAYKNNINLNIRFPFAIRPWTYVLDVCRGYTDIASYMVENKKLKFDSFNFSSNVENLTVKDLAKNIFKKLRYKNKLLFNSSFIGKEASSIKLNNKKAKNVLGWVPLYNEEQIINITVEWYQKVLRGENSNEVSEKLVKKYIAKINNIKNKNSTSFSNELKTHTKVVGLYNA